MFQAYKYVDINKDIVILAVFRFIILELPNIYVTKCMCF